MRRLWTAIKAFFAVLGNRQVAERVQAALQAPEQAPQLAVEVKAEKRPATGRSDALTLLAELQREARFVDFIMESLDQYPDAQIGAAVRDIHRQCKAVLMRLFDIAPLVDKPEGSPMEVPAAFDPGKFSLTGRVEGEPPYQGKLVHHGWIARKCDVPQWTGSNEAAQVIAAAEVEIS